MKGLKPGQVPLERALSKLGIASRTQGRAWILEGRVSVNGVIIRQPARGVVPERARIEVDGKLAEKPGTKTFIVHKPRGLVTSKSDEKGRKTVFSLVESLGLHLIAVGRLDLATTGLLLLTNDTKLAAWLTDPANRIPRRYLVTVRGRVGQPDVAKLEAGVRDQGELLRADSVELQKASGKESHLVVELNEGKNREIRRLFLSIGHEVTRLKRVSFGPLELGRLPPGDYRELTEKELRSAFPAFSWPERPSRSTPSRS